MVFEIAIIGAGLGGPALALELLNVPNVNCVIYEMRPEGFEQGQHISLAPNALRVTENIGVFEKLKTIGNTYENLHLRNAQASQIATFHNGKESDYGYKAMRIHRRHVQQTLVEACLAKGIRIVSDMKLKTILEKPGTTKVQLTFENGQIALVDFVAGVDGLHSVVRKHVAPGAETVWAGMLGVTGYLQKSKLHSSVNQIGLPSHFIGQNGFIGIMPSDRSGNEMGFFLTMDYPKEKSRTEWTQLFNDKNAIRGILREVFTKDHGWCDLVDSMCASADEDTLCSWPFHITPQLPTWSSSSGRVVIFGDAAHAMIPTGGLGASLALEDAECLAKALKHVSLSKFDPTVLRNSLVTWEEHRRVRLALAQEFTDRNRRLRQPGGKWLVQTMKEWAVWSLFKFVGSGGMAEAIYQYDTKEFEKMLSTA